MRGTRTLTSAPDNEASFRSAWTLSSGTRYGSETRREDSADRITAS